MTVTRSSLVDVLFTQVGLSKKEAKEFVTVFFDEIHQTFVSGKNLKLPGFGKFEIREKSERMGRNPKTGKAAVISKRSVITFRPGQKLKNLVKDHAHKPPSTEI